MYNIPRVRSHFGISLGRELIIASTLTERLPIKISTGSPRKNAAFDK